MLTLMTALAVLQAAPAAAAKPADNPRALSKVPGVQINYYDVQGTTGKAIEKSLKSILAAPGDNNAARVFTWTLGGGVTKQQNGDVCTITAAKLTLTPVAYIPRLAQAASVPAPVEAEWKPYAASVERLAAENLWFVVDRLPAIERSLVGKPCDQVQPAMTAASDQLKKDAAAFSTQLQAQIAAEQAAAAKKMQKERPRPPRL